MAGCMVHLRTSLLRHPSFWAQEEPVHLIDQVLEDSGVIASEKQVYAALSSQTTMMVANLDEHTCNVGFHSSQNDCFRRLLASGAGETSGFTWEDRHLAFQKLNKLSLGHERLIDEDDSIGAERRITKRLCLGKLQAVPPLRPLSGPVAGRNSLFEAFSSSMWGSTAYHLPLRQLVVDYMRQSPEDYINYLGDDYDAYLTFMARPGVAGDELVLRALADRFGVPITVVSGDETIWALRYPPRHTLSDREIFLAVAPAASFSSVKRQSALTSLKLTFSQGAQSMRSARVMRKKLFVSSSSGTTAAPPPPTTD